MTITATITNLKIKSKAIMKDLTCEVKAKILSGWENPFYNFTEEEYEDFHKAVCEDIMKRNGIQTLSKNINLDEEIYFHIYFEIYHRLRDNEADKECE